MTETTVARDIFVGREAERAKLHQLLRDPGPTQVYHLYGGGGIGKTSLLEWIVKEVHLINGSLAGSELADTTSPDQAITATAMKQVGITHIQATPDLVDFYKTGIHTILGLLSDIARQLDPGGFAAFMNEREEYEELIDVEPDPSQRNEKMERVLDAFFAAYAEYTRHTFVVLLFDTFEASGWVGENLLQELLPNLTRNTLVVVVGRQKITFREGLKVHSHTLEPLCASDAIVLFRQRGVGEQVATDEQITQITELVQGRPIYLNLAVDWIANAQGVVEKLLTPDPTEELGRALVRHVLDLKVPEDQAVLYLAYIWRLGEPALLAHLMEKSPEEIGGIVQKLSRFSFVKYRPRTDDFPGSCLLHDEMRDLVDEHCWNDYDRTGQLRKALLRSTIGYYQQTLLTKTGDALVAEGKRRARDRGLRNYQAEWLYYQLRLDLQEGLKRMDPLVRDATQHRDLPFCQQLLEELERKELWDKLSNADKAEHYFRRGLVMYRRTRYQEAEEYFRRITGPHPFNLKYKATALQTWAEMDSDRGQIALGLERVRQAEAIYQDLLASKPDDLGLKKELGELYNNWGRLLRVQGDLHGAKAYYTKALNIYKTLPAELVDKGRARTLNNLGFVFRLEGDLTEAKTLCGLALQVRKKIENRYELGLSYNTMGLVLEDDGNLETATDMYEDALAIFEDIRNDYGRAMALISVGRMCRRANDFDRALGYLHKARELAEKRLRNPQFAAEALNEIACVYRERKQDDDLAHAESHFRQSAKIAREYGGHELMVDDLVNVAVLHARQGDQALTESALAEVASYLDHPDFHYFRSWANWARATVLWESGLKLEQDGQVGEARHKYQEAFQMYLQAAAECVKNIQRGHQGRRATQRYQRILDEIQGRLHARPAIEIPAHVEWLKGQWEEFRFGEQYDQLAKICDDSLKYAQYL